MPSWISKAGKWFPAQEFHIDNTLTKEDVEAGKSPVYKGPDRAAVELLQAEGVEFLGQDYHMNPDLIRMSRELNFKTVDEYLKVMFNFDPAESEKAQEEKAKKVNEHKNPDPKKAIEELAGGRDESGKGQHRKGGFGDPADVPVNATKQRA